MNNLRKLLLKREVRWRREYLDLAMYLHQMGRKIDQHSIDRAIHRYNVAHEDLAWVRRGFSGDRPLLGRDIIDPHKFVFP